MRRILALAAIVSVLALTASALAQQPPPASPKLKETLDQMKAYAATKQGLISRSQVGTMYFKWIQSPPPDYEKAFFQLGELNKGTRFLSLKLIRKTAAGYELTVLNDNDVDTDVEEAYRATGRTLAEADKALQTTQDKLKVPVTPDMISAWTAMIDELKWELKSN